MKGPYLEKLPVKLASFENFLGDRKFFCGDSPTFPDFHMYEMLVQHKMLAPEQIKARKNLTAFMERFEALPKIKAHIDCDRYVFSWANLQLILIIIKMTSFET